MFASVLSETLAAYQNCRSNNRAASITEMIIQLLFSVPFGPQSRAVAGSLAGSLERKLKKNNWL